MSTEENQAILRQCYDELFNKGNLAIADKLYAPGYVLNHTDPVNLPHGPEGVRQYVSATRSAFPDIRVTVDDIVAEGDKTVARFTMQGTQTGQFYSAPPSGKRAVWSGIILSRYGGGKILEETLNVDSLGLLMQLGVIPSPG